MSSDRRARPAGRPRRPEVDASITAATIDLLAEVGYDAVTIEAVAARAGVSRPTLYRRFESKAELVADAFRATLAHANPIVPDTGDAHDDLRVLLSNLVQALTATAFGTAVTEAIGPAGRDEHLMRAVASARDQRRELMRAVVERARRDGRLRGDDVEVAIDMVLGAIYYRHLISQQPMPAEFVAALAGSVITPAHR